MAVVAPIPPKTAGNGITRTYNPARLLLLLLANAQGRRGGEVKKYPILRMGLLSPLSNLN